MSKNESQDSSPSPSAVKTAKRKLKLLEAKKEILFIRLQSTYDLLNNLDSDASRETFHTRCNRLPKTEQEFSQVIETINEINLDLNEDYVVNFKPLSTFDDMYTLIKTKLNEINKDNIAEIGMVRKDSKSKIQLQPISVPKFSGTEKEWPGWFRSFKSLICDDLTLSDTHRMHFLTEALTGKAKAFVSELPGVTEEFSVVMEALKERFEDPRMLASSYMDSILDFKQPPRESAASIDAFLQTVVTPAKAFLNLNIPNHADYILYHLALSRLHPDTVRQFDSLTLSSKQDLDNSSSDSHQNSIPTFNQLTKFLREHAKMLARQPATKHSSLNFNNKKYNNPKPTHSLVVSKPSPLCPACGKESHALYICQNFKKLPIKDRFSLVKRNGNCFNCFSFLHKTAQCKSERHCSHCSQRHHSLIHFPKEPFASTSNNNATASSQLSDKEELGANSSSVSLSSYNSTQAQPKTSVLLATAKVIINDFNHQSHEVRALIDCGSQSNLITLDCCNKLGLPKKKINSTIKGIGSVSSSIQYMTRFTFYSRLNKTYKFTIDALVINNITTELPTAPLTSDSLKHLDGLILADNSFNIPGKIDILLGASLFPHLIQSGKIYGPNNTPVALKSCLGYIVMGSVVDISPTPQSQVFCSFNEDDKLDKLVTQFWSLEDVPAPNTVQTVPSLQEAECEDIFRRSVVRSSDGRYSVALPFKTPPSELGNSWHSAFQCFISLERRLAEQPSIREKYHAFLQDHLDQGHLSITDDSSEGCFLPHHYVLKPDSVSTKLRVVWNASARTSSGLSLNDILHTGPKLQSDLRSVLLRFRAFLIAVTADIKQMFLQILILPEHRKYLKFLWRFSPNENISTYVLNTVTFGVKPSPYLAQRVLKKLAENSRLSWPKLSGYIDNDFYIDDFCSSFPTIEHAISVQQSLVSMLLSGGFELVKWCSNSPKFLEKVPKPLHMPNNNLSFSKEILKILGLNWNANSDNFMFDIMIPMSANTKREILSLLAHIFDPIGLVSPLTVFIKIILHDLWCAKYSWDEVLDPTLSIVKNWNTFFKSLSLIKSIKVPRFIGLIPGQTADLIGFCDASSKAYGAVIYVRTLHDGKPRIELLTSRSKIAKKNILTIPRLELCAATLLSRLFSFVIQSYRNLFEFNTLFAFTDSSITLWWILSSPSRWNSFVCNRVMEIQSSSFQLDWRHVAGVDNPADCLSRGLLPSEFRKHHLWFSGPQWLKHDPRDWPQRPTDPTREVFTEERKTIAIITNNVPAETSLLRTLIEKYSSYNKLLRIIATILSWKSPNKRKKGFLSSEELLKAELILLRFVQREHFAEELVKINNNDNCSPSIRKLNPFFDNTTCLIRVGGRLSQSGLQYASQHPVLLPKRDSLVNLLVDHYHSSNLHTGPNLVLSLLRKKYWVLSARSLVRQRLNKCNFCFRARPKTRYPLMGDLPPPRVTQSKPFLHTGVDYAGPFFVTPYKKRGVRSHKVYICLFVCLCVKAVHIEIASDLSTETFLNAFKRFLSRRGPVQVMYSDCGTNFIGARSYLNEIYQLVSTKPYNEDLGRELASRQITWKFNPPSAPHMGGIWESQVKSVKTHLFRVTQGHTLTMEEFSTVLTQIEALLNSRPLGLVQSGPNDPVPLTPAHFLMQVPLCDLPAVHSDQQVVSTVNRYKLLDQLVSQFWRRWHLEYLHTLQIREKWNTPSNPITEGTIVVVQKESTPPLKWPLAKVVELHPGKDGIVRVVTIRCGTSLYRRPVAKLCPLPTQ